MKAEYSRAEVQKLIDACFEIGMMMGDNGVDRAGNPIRLGKMSIDEKGEWIARQLKSVGFPTRPMGSSWGVLVK